MALNFLQPIDLNQNQLDNAVIQNFTTATIPVSGKLGQVLYDTTLNKMKICTIAQVGATNATYSIIGGAALGAGAGLVITAGNVAVDYSSTGIIDDANDGTSVTLVDTDEFLFEDANGTAATAVQRATLSQLKTYIGADGNTTYTLPVTAGAANTAVVTLTGTDGNDSTLTISGKSNETTVTETAGANGTIVIGLPDDVTIGGKLTVSGVGNDAIAITGRATSAATRGSDVDTTLTTKGYVDGLIEGGISFKGTFNAATGSIVGTADFLYQVNGAGAFLPGSTRVAIAQGDYYVAATAGQFYGNAGTGGNGPLLDIGDAIIGLADVAVDASVVTSWSTISQGVTVNSITTTNTGNSTGSALTGLVNATGAVTVNSLAYAGGANIGYVPTGGTNTTFLRGDGSFATPAKETTARALLLDSSIAPVASATAAGVTMFSVDVDSVAVFGDGTNTIDAIDVTCEVIDASTTGTTAGQTVFADVTRGVNGLAGSFGTGSLNIAFSGTVANSVYKVLLNYVG